MSNEAQEMGRFPGMRMDVKVMAKSLTGFDEIAIRKAFGTPFEDLTGMFGVRALLFVQLRRDGAKDGDAFKAVMEATVGDITVVVGMDEDEDGEVEGNGERPTQTTL